MTAEGIDGLTAMPGFDDIAIVFDATSAGAHARHDEVLRRHGKQIIDLTPAAIGPYVVPAVNLDQLTTAPNVNMVTCGGQATIPIVAAVNRVAAGALRRDRGQHLQPVGRTRARAPTSTSSRRPPPGASSASAVPGAARRSSCSIRPSRR